MKSETQVSALHQSAAPGDCKGGGGRPGGVCPGDGVPNAATGKGQYQGSCSPSFTGKPATLTQAGKHGPLFEMVLSALCRPRSRAAYRSPLWGGFRAQADRASLILL